MSQQKWAILISPDSSGMYKEVVVVVGVNVSNKVEMMKSMSYVPGVRGHASSVAFCGHTALLSLPSCSSSFTTQKRGVLTVLRRSQLAARTSDVFGSALARPRSRRACGGARMTAQATLLSSLVSAASTSAGVLVLGFIVFVHESGHFLAARWQNIRVKNFSVGFGPKLFSFTPKQSETEFTIRLLPLGGYVAFPEHMIEDEKTGEQVVNTDPDLLQNRPILDRALVISAGVIANLILAWSAIFISVSAVGIPSYVVEAGVAISSIVDGNGAAAQAGVRTGDLIMSMDGVKIGNRMSNAGEVAEIIRTSKGRAIIFGLSRDNEPFELSIRPKCCSADGNAAMGVQLTTRAKVSRTHPKNVLASIVSSNNEFGRVCTQTWGGLVAAVKNYGENSQQLSGPIGVVSMGANLARNDATALLTFCAVISINLALINSLPLPALDGGQMAFLMIEAARGSPVSVKVQDAVNRTALLMLLVFSGVVLFGDLEKFNVVGAIQKLFS